MNPLTRFLVGCLLVNKETFPSENGRLSSFSARIHWEPQSYWKPLQSKADVRAGFLVQASPKRTPAEQTRAKLYI